MLKTKKCLRCKNLFMRTRQKNGRLRSPLEKRKFCSRSCARLFVATSHGMSHTPTHNTWLGIKKRCANSSAQNYYLYGGRNIGVCKRWAKFENFLKDMGKKPVGKSIDRINVNKGYSPKNCRWATIEQQMNNKRNNVFITYKNKTLSIAQWSRITGINYSTLRQRIIVYRWDVKKALHV